MKNYGFTLVELIAVVAILGVLALVVTVSVNSTLTNSEKKLNAIQIEKIKDAAKIYYLNEGKSCVNVSYLIENDYIEKMNIKNSEENGTLGSVKITYNSKKYIYEYQENKCYYMGSVCNIVSGEEKQIGSKYECKVKDDMEEDFEDGYYFYVLSYNDNEGNLTDDITEAKSLNLIMDQNINNDGTPAGMTGVTQSTNASQYNLVAWNNESGQSANKYGPVTSMHFLYNATKDWTNIAPVNYTYNDKTIQGTGYISFVSIYGVATITPLTGDGVIIGTSDVPLRARMPIYASDESITEVATKTDANAYLYDNLDSSGDALPYGYWTLSSLGGDSYHAWSVRYHGYVYDEHIESNYGVRPVITLEI